MFTRPTRCPNPDCRFHGGPEGAEELYGTSQFWTRMGHYRRRIDRREVPRYRCRSCGRSFSSQTDRPSYRERRADVNGMLFRLLCSGVTFRRAAAILGVHRGTVADKARRMADRALAIHGRRLADGGLRASLIQFDEMQTFLHTRLKPVTVAVAATGGGEIVAVDVAPISPFGSMVHRARRKYPEWRDGRRAAQESVLREVGRCAEPGAEIRTDASRHYRPLVERHAPGARLVQHISPGNRDHHEENPASGGHDPMFALNHLFATLRQDLSRLGRSTWATTKSLEGLLNHLMLYVAWRNEYEIA